MLWSTAEIIGYKIKAKDGDLGKVNDFYFDDREWTYRYLVADTGKWLPGRQVLISPAEVSEPHFGQETVPINLTKDQIEKSPEIHADLPISRQQEMGLVGYYDWVPYWEPVGPTGGGIPVVPFRHRKTLEREENKKDYSSDPHLRSFKEIYGYKIHAKDEESIGKARDLISDAEKWVIRYLVVDTGKWLSERNILISLPWIEYVDESEKCIQLDLNAERIKKSPEFDWSKPVSREYETRLFDHYSRSKYWE
jgi:hypothetical protein